MIFALILSMLICTAANGQHESTAAAPINILVLVPWPDNREYAGWDVGLELLPGSRIAAREINARHNILQGFNITTIEAGHDACGVTVHPLTLTNLVWTSIPPLSSNRTATAGVLGLYCSALTAELSRVAGRTGVDLIQLSASYSPLFNDRLNEFRHLFRFVPSADIYTDLLIHITNQYDWNRLAIVTNTENFFYYGISTSLIKAIDKTGKELVYAGSLVKRIKSFTLQVISDIIETRARIIILSAPSYQIADLVCEAYRRDMKYPNYLWIIMDWTLEFLKTELTNCDSEEQLISALEGSIMFYLHYVPRNTSNMHETLSTNKSQQLDDSRRYAKYQKFVEDYKKELETVKEDYKNLIKAGNVTLLGNIEYASILYNQVYGLSLAMNNSISELKAINMTLDEYKYGQPEATEIIENNLKRVVFDGFTGQIRFNDRNEVTLPINVFQVIEGEEVLIHRIANISKLDENEHIELNLSETVDDTVPIEYVTISTALTLVLCTCVLALLILVTLVLVLILKYRHVRKVRANSVKVSMLMFVACYCFITVDIIIIILCSVRLTELAYSALCNLSYFLFYNSSIMLFSAQIFKQQRINMIFSNSTLKVHGWRYSNWMLVLKTMIICLIGDIVLIIIISIKFERQDFYIEYKLRDGITVEYKYPTCYGQDNIVDPILFYGLYSCIGIMLVLNVYHATSAKNTMKEDYKITKFVNLYTIIVFITLCITVPFKEVFFFENPNVLYINVVVFFSVFISASLAQLILFLPLILHVLKKKL